MILRFINWWIRNASYIGPIATCVTALAGLWSVIIVTRTFRHARLDRKEEIEARHPRFTSVSAKINLSFPDEGDHFFELSITLKNIREHSAKHLKLKLDVFLDPSTMLFQGEYDPTHYIEPNGDIHVTLPLSNIAASDKSYFIHAKFSYLDARTQKAHGQDLWWQCYFQGDDKSSYELKRVDRKELNTRMSPTTSIGAQPVIEIENPSSKANKAVDNSGAVNK